MTVEDRLRATSLAITDTMREVRPLTLPPAAPSRDRRARRVRGSGRARAPRSWTTFLAPVTAAVAVLAIAATLVAVRGLSGGPRIAPAMALGSAAGIPAYYVSLEDAGLSPKGAVERNAFLADTRTGKRLATVKPPSDAFFTYAAGSSDGKTFVLEATAGPGSGPAGDVTRVPQGRTALWYVLHVAPGTAQHPRLTRIPIASSDTGLGELGLAVSADGRTLASLSMTQENPGKVTRPPLLQLQTYSVDSGRLLRSWTASGTAWVGPPADLTWLDDGHTVGFVASASATRRFLRTLDTTSPGTSLVSSSRPVFSVPHLCSYPLLAADGKSVICGTASFFPESKPACNKGGIQLAAYSVATGRLERVLYRYSGDCSWGTAIMLWAKSSTLAVAAIVVTRSTPLHPQISRLVAAAGGKASQLPVTTWNGYGSIAF